jgi:hypothetical protein
MGLATVRTLSRSFTLLDAMVSPDGYTTYAFHARWGEDQELASMDNGSGNEYSIAFTASGAFIRGFDHESPMSPYGDEDHATWPGLVESVPSEFAAQVTDPAFCDDEGAGRPSRRPSACGGERNVATEISSLATRWPRSYARWSRERRERRPPRRSGR